MKNDNLKSKISIISGLLLIIIFLIFTFTALALFPSSYNPLNNWLSDLGNSSYNPIGSIFFNLGCILTGLLLFIFFLGLQRWSTSSNVQKNMLKIGQLLGLFSAVSLIMIGIFSEDYGSLHWTWSALFFVSLLFVLITINLALMLNPYFKKRIFVYGIISILIDLSFIMLYIIPNNLPKPLFEWMSVLVSLGWLGMVVYNTAKIKEC